MNTQVCATRESQEFDIEGPIGLPEVGVLPYLQEDTPGFLLNCARTYKGNLIPMMVGPLRVWLLAHPDAVDHICRTNAKNYVKTRFAEKLKPLLGNGVATSNGRIWEASRSVIHPMLRPSEIEHMLKYIDSVILDELPNWQNNLMPDSDLVDMAKESCSTTLRVILKSLFGEGAAGDVGAVIRAIDKVQLGLRDYIWSADPDHGPDPSVTHPGFAAALKQVFDAVLRIIEKRDGLPPQKDMLSALQAARHPDTGEPYSAQQILDEVMTLYIAGHETTGNTLSWIWETFARQPELQALVREELLAKIPLDKTPTLEMMRNLPVTSAVIQETMRLKPSAFWFARTALEDDVVAGQPIKAGDSFIVSQYVIQRLEEYWPEPDLFDHTRWLEGRKPDHKFAYIPFGAGVRNCPGGHFAMAEMVLVLARALAHYEFSLPEANTPPRGYEALFTLRPKQAMPLRLKKYERTHYIKGTEISRNCLLEASFRLRADVFVKKLGWPLKVDEQGRELDQFDQDESGYFIHISEGRLIGCARVLPTEKPTLLYDVFPHLITDESAKLPAPDILEGARLAIRPDLCARASNRYCARLLADLIEHSMLRGIKYLYTVSDPVMERVLRRAGASPQRLGPVVLDKYNIPALALRLCCTTEIVNACRAAAKDFKKDENPESVIGVA